MAVAELELDAADGTGARIRTSPGGPPLGPRDGEEQRIFALVRLRGRPVGTVVGRVGAGDDPASVLAEQAADEIGVPDALERPPAGEVPRATVVVATRERPAQLARALDSLLAQDHPDFETVVVDNAPVTGATRDLVTSAYAGRGVRYVREPVPGLAVAHNRGLLAAEAGIVAFTDDDVIADPHWLSALTRPFGEDPALACATGLILPARLSTPAQILLESHGGFAKGFAARRYDPAHPPADEPLFPFTAGRFGSGANMAFRAGALKAVGGFDPATGTGTAAKGGDDLYAFVRLLAEGHPLHYTPDAIVWHHHRERWEDLCGQAYGYGAGLTACLTALLVRRPALLPSLLARLPRGLAHALTMTAPRAIDAAGGGVPGAHGAYTYPWPRHLSRLERRGLLYGPLGYARARFAVRAARPGETR
ncbi:glycosyltransferase family 2 protein [Streptomyces sp. QL37]|uniref:glycosyltransferase n=1 Tax=Streptomyces sp. QL37 TaxID=2093747 RepID=UPI000CF290B6|nr:glycosyltransferase [Streptomyces sp. QL37]PPQ62354.1 glycosyl transferase family 2 [Streptomyces sp. QL37]